MTDQPIILAIELSQRAGSIAVSDRSGNILLRETETGRREEDDVMPSIASAFEELGVLPKEIGAVVVSIGPGGFTGLRTSIAIAKMVALATGAKIIPVESAIVIVGEANQGNGPFLVIASVKHDGFWLSRVQRHNEQWRCDGGLSMSSKLDQHIGGIEGVFADDFLPEATHRFLQECGTPIFPSKPSAKQLLQEGLLRYGLGLDIDPLILLPLYPGEPEAVRRWNVVPKHNKQSDKIS